MAERHYKGWALYFPNEDETPDDRRVALIDNLLVYFEGEGAYILEQAGILCGSHVLPLDYTDVRQHASMATFPQALLDHPEETIACAGLAVQQVLLRRGRVKSVLEKILVRVYRYEPVTPLKSLKSNVIGRFVSVRGTVLRVSTIRPLVVQMHFQCAKCGEHIPCCFVDGKYAPPTRCVVKGCRSKSFLPEHSSVATVDWQKIRIQEVISDDLIESGRMPRTVECELTHDLVDSCVPGDEVTVCGTVKVVSTEADTAARSKSKNKCLYYVYIDANSISNSKKTQNGKLDFLQFSLRDLRAINEIANEVKLFHLITHSLCPSIYGHEMVKAGLVLALFGGWPKFLSDKNRIQIRGDPHILVVGDPGLGKSQMLRAVSNVAPRGVYVCGNTTTSSGLTVTVVRDATTGDFALEAGALVLGDQGCCCIDEFDKMSNDYAALLEAMEQQTISIAKAGIVCSLSTRTAVIAAANPVGGHYHRGKTIAENLKLSAALLSRFDLIFILLDTPDQTWDKMLSEHVMKLHAGDVQGMKDIFRKDSMAGILEADKDDTGRISLAANLKLPREGQAKIDTLPPVLLRKYIAYARQYVHPKLTPAACKVLQDFYLDLRKRHRGADAIPVTTRQLESLMRLSEARARVELREAVTEDDARDVVEIFKESLLQTYTDELGNLRGIGRAKDATRFLTALQKESDRQGKSVFTVQELQRVAHNVQVQMPFDTLIDSLNYQNYILKKGPGKFKLQISACSDSQCVV